MNKEFVPYEQALALKELGFNEECFAHFVKHYDEIKCILNSDDFDEWWTNNSDNLECKAPLYQQAFRWLYQKLSIENGTMLLDTETQQLLLKELIDKVSSKQETVKEDAKRAFYFELVDKKAESNNTIDLNAYAKGVEDGVIWQAKRLYSEEELREALYYALSVNKSDGIIITTDSQIVRDAIKFIKQDKILTYDIR